MFINMYQGTILVKCLLTFHCWLYTLYIIVYVTNKKNLGKKQSWNPVLGNKYYGTTKVLYCQGNTMAFEYE